MFGWFKKRVERPQFLSRLDGMLVGIKMLVRVPRSDFNQMRQWLDDRQMVSISVRGVDPYIPDEWCIRWGGDFVIAPSDDLVRGVWMLPQPPRQAAGHFPADDDSCQTKATI